MNACKLVIAGLVLGIAAESTALAGDWKKGKNRPLPFPPGQPRAVLPAGPPMVAPPANARGYPGVAALRPGDLEKLVERSIRHQLGHCVDDVDADVDARRCLVEVEVDTRDSGAYVAVQRMLSAMPELAGYQVCLKHENLGRYVERTIERQLGHCVDDVDVDVDHRRRCVEVEARIRHSAAHGQVQQLVYSLPELAGYHIRLEMKAKR
jgi:hypothetical protein